MKPAFPSARSLATPQALADQVAAEVRRELAKSPHTYNASAIVRTQLERVTGGTVRCLGCVDDVLHYAIRMPVQVQTVQVTCTLGLAPIHEPSPDVVVWDA